jgi:hypothetical protein
VNLQSTYSITITLVLIILVHYLSVNLIIRNVRHIEIHIAEPIVPSPSCLEVDIAIASLKDI